MEWCNPHINPMLRSGELTVSFFSLCAFLDGLVSTPLTDLNLYNNQIGPEGAKAIAGALPM